MGSNPSKLQRTPDAEGTINDLQSELDLDYAGIPEYGGLGSLLNSNSDYEVDLHEKYRLKHVELSSRVPKISEQEKKNFLCTGVNSISEIIAVGFKNRKFVKVPSRNLTLPACYYKMRSIDDLKPYATNVLVIGPGMCGSSIYHETCGRNIYTVGPIEESVPNVLQYLNENNAFMEEGITLENDAMTGCKDLGPLPKYYPILDASYKLIKSFKFKSVVQKIFLNDNDKYYNALVLKIASYYNTINLMKPSGSSVGTTERYLVLTDRRPKPNQINDPKLNFLLASIKKELRLSLFELNSKSIQTSKTHDGTLSIQAERISDYRRYMLLEYELTLWYIKMIWNKLGLHSIQNVDAFKEYSSSDNLNIVKRQSNGTFVQAEIFKPYQPPLMGEYDVMFDGKKFVEVSSKLKLDGKVFYEYHADSKSDFLITIDTFRLFQCYTKLKVLRFEDMTEHKSNVFLIEGVPGCGKTYEIVHTAKKNSLILTVTKSTSLEIKQQIMQLNRVDVFVSTVDSFILQNVKEYTDVYIDEGLMLQPGEIDVIAIISKATNVYVYGDRQQLNFIPRVAGFVANIDTYTDFTSIEYRNISRRCPQDIAQAFFSYYDAGFYTTSNVAYSKKIKSISTILDVYFDHSVKYLVFTQDEKKDLLKYKFNVNTIHEVQGMTFNEVALVRLNPKQMHIYDSDAHILAACTKHTKEFTYYTTNTVDKTSKILNIDRSNIIVTNINIARSQSDKASKTTISNINRFIRPTHGFECEYRFEIISEQECVEMFSALHKELFNKLYEELFYLIRPNDVTLCDTIKTITINKPLVHMYEPPYPHIPTADICLQSFYDDMLKPHFDPSYNDFDEYHFENLDTIVNMTNVKIDMLKLAESSMNVLPDHTHTPVLRTNQTNLRKQTAKQTLVAADKRNNNAMNNAKPINMDEEINITINRFLNGLCIPEAMDMLKQYSVNPVSFTERNLYEWVKDMQTEKTKNFDATDAFKALEDISRYGLMIKDDVKNKWEPNSDSEYLVAATIVHHKPIINAIFGPIFKELFDRFTNLLNPNVMCLLKKNADDIHQHINNYLDPRERYQALELDFEKFDKSQLQMCHEIEMIIYQMLGLDQFFLSIWKAGHYKTSAKDFLNGIKFYIMYQRKSGNTTTCFGNTLLSMLSLARSVELQHLIVSIFIVDDSFLIFKENLEIKSIVRTLSGIFNLSAKTTCKEIIYTCSSFIINTGYNFVFVPDPLKIIEKLGKKLYIRDESEFVERHKSFKEMVKILNYEEIYRPLVIGMTERCKLTESSSYAFIAMWSLRSLANNYDLYRALWKSNDSLFDNRPKRTIMKA